MHTVVVIPTYNERANVLPLIERCLALPARPDLFFVDDNSPDGTGELLESLRAGHPGLRVLHRPGKLGLGSAYRQAFRLLLKEPYDCFVEMDADLSHRPESLPDLFHAAREADLVIGSRYSAGGGVKNWCPFRLLLSRTANHIARRLLGLTVMDATAGFRCYRRELLAALDHLDIRSNGYAFQVEMTYFSQLMGFRLREVPIVFEDRLRAASKMCRSEITRAAATLLRLLLHRLSRQGAADRLRLAAEGLGPKVPPRPAGLCEQPPVDF
ncbi:MAG: polyprenol monophosphomannose synthase [Nitrospirota bacterium]